MTTSPGRFSVPLDPEVGAVIADFGDFSDLGPETLPAARRQLDVAWSDPAPGVRRETHELEAPAGATVRVHLHLPEERETVRSCLLWLHGGGYVMGSCAAGAAELDRWCTHLRCVAMSVEYRLAPEHPYPAALDDAYAALAWIHSEGRRFGVDSVGIVGSSAGGGLAAALCLLARDRAEFDISAQCLQYPMLDDRFVTESSRWTGTPVWSKEANLFAWEAYLGGATGQPDTPAYAAPSRAEDLSGLPPTLLLTGTADGFVDEVLHYARRLAHCGVPTDLRVYGGATHGFLTVASTSSVARRAQRDMDEWLTAHVRMSASPAAESRPIREGA